MLEYGAVWTVVGADGTTVILNDGASGWYLEEVTGNDSPNVRQNLEDLPEADGAVAGDYFYGSRPMTFRGKIVAASASARNSSVVSFQRAFRGLRSDITLKAQASGLPAMQATARLDSLRITGGMVKDYLVAVTCYDPRFYSEAENTETGAGGGISLPGAGFPWSFPINWGGGSGATLFVNVTNAGNFDSPPTVRVTGPIANPQLTNDTTDLSLYLDNVTLTSGQWVEVDFGARTVVNQDGASLYDRVRFPGSVWWMLQAGSNTVQLWGSGTDGTTGLEVRWRDSWA